jgi:hypothetical protein
MWINDEIQTVSENKYIITFYIYLRRLINWQGVTYTRNYNINSYLKSNDIFSLRVHNLQENFNEYLH